MKIYAQFNKENICTAVGTPNITGVEATYENLGQKYEEGIWINQEKTSTEKRNEAYKTLKYQDSGEPLILFGGEIYTCDKALDMISIYAEEDKFAGTNKAQQLGERWVAGKDYIRKKYSGTFKNVEEANFIKTKTSYIGNNIKGALRQLVGGIFNVLG